MIRTLSLGFGVQSSVLLLMSDAGQLEPLDAAIAADTQREPESVYRWLEFLKARRGRTPIHVVTKGDLGAASLVVRKSKKSGMMYQKNLIPWFVKNPDGTDGFMNRKCTSEFKIREVLKKQREILGKKTLNNWRKAWRPELQAIERASIQEKAERREKVKSELLLQLRETAKKCFESCQADALVECWIGISTDEATRAKPSREPWIRNRFPLIEKGMSRGDCLIWCADHGLPRPPKSSCKFCPYHSDAEWVRLQNDEPREFMEAVAFEKAAQIASKQDEVIKGTIWLHSSRKPLDQVKFDPSDGFGYNCDGYCNT